MSENPRQKIEELVLTNQDVANRLAALVKANHISEESLSPVLENPFYDPFQFLRLSDMSVSFLGDLVITLGNIYDLLVVLTKQESPHSTIEFLNELLRIE